MADKIGRFTLGVVIPTYITSDSGLDRLRDTLISLKNQKFSPEEIVISDDSPNRFSNRIADLIKEFTDLKINFQVNVGRRGVSPNSNFGIEALSTSYVHCLHQDDLITDANCYKQLKESYESKDFSWFILGGMAGNMKITPALRNGRLPSELYLGLNTIGGPSALVFPRMSEIKFDADFSMLCDVKFLIDTFNILGAPNILSASMIRYGVGDWQLQRRINEGVFMAELETLNSRNIRMARAAFWEVFKYPKRYDVKVRSLEVLFKITKNPIYFSAFIVLKFLVSRKVFFRRRWFQNSL